MQQQRNWGYMSQTQGQLTDQFPHLRELACRQLG